MNQEKSKKVKLKLDTVLEWILMLLIFSSLTVVINTLSYKNDLIQSLPGILVLSAITFVGLLLGKLIPLKVPPIIYMSIIGLVISLPVFGPVSDFVFESTSRISTLALCTVILSYSGIAIAKSWADFKEMGWRSILVTLCVILGTFLGSTIVAELVLKAQGII